EQGIARQGCVARTEWLMDGEVSPRWRAQKCVSSNRAGFADRRFIMADLTLYHAAPSRSSIVLWMLEEVGAPYDVNLLKLSEGANLKPDYLAINPMGKVPALRHGDVVITEVAAICTYLADAFPEKKLNVPIGDP